MTESAPIAPHVTAPHPPVTGAIDLFPMTVVRAAAGPASSASWGGTSRRAGTAAEAARIAGELDADGERVASGVKGAIGELSGRRDVEAGRVSPRWREVEREIDASFHPAASTITDESGGRLVGRQFLAPDGIAASPQRDKPAPHDDANRGGLSGWENRGEQFLEAQRRASAAAAKVRVEIETVVAADGALESTTVVLSSGRAPFDAAALDAVKRAMAGRTRESPDPGNLPGLVVLRWAVEGAVRLSTPTVTPAVDPLTGQVQGAGVDLIGPLIDAVAHRRNPFGKRVTTRVELISLTRREH